jgi:lipopolysaccharide cholinephosphotransferase
MRTHTLKGDKIVSSQDHNRPQVMNFEIANQYLQDLKQVFDEVGIEFFLFYGTLVGAIREENFVKFDDDVDVAIMRKDVSKLDEASKKFRNLGYIICSCSIVAQRSFFYISKKEIPKNKVDVYVLFEFEDQLWFPRHTVYKDRGATIVAIPYPKKYFKKFDTIEFLGAEYKVPSPVEEFLEVLWGDWWVVRGGQFGKIPAKMFTPEEFEQKINKG